MQSYFTFFCETFDIFLAQCVTFWHLFLLSIFKKIYSFTNPYHSFSLELPSTLLESQSTNFTHKHHTWHGFSFCPKECSQHLAWSRLYSTSRLFGKLEGVLPSRRTSDKLVKSGIGPQSNLLTCCSIRELSLLACSNDHDKRAW